MTGKRYLRRKRILGVSAIVLAVLLMALPAFTRAAEVETTLNSNFSMVRFIEMCTDSGLASLGNITKVSCVTAKDGDGWIECGENTDPNMICVKLDGTELKIYVPEDLTKVTSEPNLYFSGGNPNRFSGANPFNMDALLSILDTSNYTTMQQMFAGVAHAESLDVSGFNTHNVTNMLGMFAECWDLKSLDLSGFNTSNVTNMNTMFWGCSSLDALEISSFNTESVTDMEMMFYGCSSLTELDLSSFTVNAGTDVDDMLSGCTNLNIIHTPTSTAKDIALPDTYYHLCEYGTWEMDGENIKTYTSIPANNTEADPKSIILVRDDAYPTITPAAILSPSAAVSPTGGIAIDSPAVSPTATVSPTVTATVSPSPIVTVTPIPTPTHTPTPTPTPTQAPTKSTLVIVDNRADQANTDKITATVSNLVGSLKLIINDDDGADIKKIQPLKKGQVLIPYDIYLIDNSGNRYTNFGSCTITLPIPDSLDLTKGTLAVVAAKSSNVLENVSNTKLVKNNVNCVQFTATHFSEYGLLWTPYTELTGAVTPSVTPATTPTTTQAAATAAAKATSSAGGSGSGSGSFGSKSGSSSSSSSSATTNRNGKAVPVSGVKGYSNAKDMPKTGDGDVYRILGAIILFLFGSIELVSSVKVKSAE